MLELSENFQAQLDNGGKPATIVHVQEDVIEAEKTLEVDWAANTAESNVDYTSSPPFAGDVILSQTSIPKEENLTGNTWSRLGYGFGDSGGPYYESEVNQHWQSFKHTLGMTVGAGIAKGYFKRMVSGGGTNYRIYCSIWNADRTIQQGTTITTYFSSTTGEWVSFDFSSQDIDIENNTEYEFKFVMDVDTGADYEVETWQKYQNTNVYTNGQFDKTGDSPGTNLGDLMFEISFTGDYYQASGYLTTDNFDLGATPTAPGEWQMQDTKPDGTALTYEAWSSATGVFGGEETYLGTVADGDSITNLKEYYRVKSTLTANTARNKTPTLHSIKADFSTYKTFTDCLRIAQENDYEMGLMPISGISSEINDFKESTIGQITPTLDFNESVSKYLYGKYPKNKIIKVLIGFDDPAFAVSDFLEFFRGQVVDYNITSDDKVNLITQAFQVEWSKKIPETWEDSGDDVTWTNMHPTDVMLDIIRNYMDVRDSKIVASSFADVKALIPSFRVTRTITKNPVEAKKLMEELRLLTGCYFLPSSAGKIKIKRFDSTEAVVATLTDANTKGLSYKGNLKSLINKTLVYYAHDGEGDDAVDYTELQLDVSTGATSNENWGEWKTKEIKDKWTLAEDSAQVISMSDDQLARYKDPPAIIQRVGDKKLLYIEAGDMVAVTIKRAPSADGMSGIVDKKFQVIRPTLDFKGNKVTLMLLEA